MTSGIYKLTFANGSFYIGKSNNIQRRLVEHADKLRKCLGSKAMQAAYSAYGFPDYEVLLECHSDHIDIMETYYIMRLRPNLNSAGTVPLSSVEYSILNDSFSMLNLSTCEHIKLIESQTSKEKELLNVVSNLSAKRTKAELAMSLRTNLKSLETENSALRSKIRYLELPWWKRLFN